MYKQNAAECQEHQRNRNAVKVHVLQPDHGSADTTCATVCGLTSIGMLDDE